MLSRVSGLPLSETVKTGTACAPRGVWRRVLGVEHTGDRVGGTGAARPRWGGAGRGGAAEGRCGTALLSCARRCPGYDSSRQPRRWLRLDLETTQVFLQARTRRVSRPEHGVVVAAVPWARPGSRFTAAFEDTCAWLGAARRRRPCRSTHAPCMGRIPRAPRVTASG